MRPTSLSLAAMVIALLISSAAHATKNWGISEQPPEPIYEVELGKRPGYILSPGYWRWDGRRHVWTPSRWIKEREGYTWQPDIWIQRGDQWQLSAGHWEKDELIDEEIVEDEAVEPVAAAPAKAKKKIKKRKKIDYTDPRQYPRRVGN